MAKLFEYQGKNLLSKEGIKIPESKVCSTPEEALNAAKNLGYPLVLKIQAWVTGRASKGGIKFAENESDVKKYASEMLGMQIGNFKVNEILVEKKLEIEKEFYAGIIINDASKQPVFVFSSKGGSGIEEIAKKHPQNVTKFEISVNKGFSIEDAKKICTDTKLERKLLPGISETLVKLYKVCKNFEARSAEINPLVVLKSGEIVAADCHITIDDYAVFRHPETGVEIAREFDRPPTELERISYNVEKGDYRGTFYFIQMTSGFIKGEGYIGFHGAGGGGSMMSMDAVLKEGFKIANFCDTSGNPPASKVYRAAKIILSQKGIDAYFGSGSGVASQEQFHSARGLLKAFLETNIDIPVVIRLGGNQEEKAIDILTKYAQDLSVPVECYGKDTPASYCAKRLKELVKNRIKKTKKTDIFKRESAKKAYSFKTVTGGTVTYDHSLCEKCETKTCVKGCIPGILKLDNGKPILAISEEEAGKGKCTECLVCEIECFFHGNKGAKIDLPIPGLKEYRKS